MKGYQEVQFSESGAPPRWLRLLLLGVPLGAVGLAWLTAGADSAAGAAVAALVVLVCGVVPLELGQVLYGGVVVAEGRLHVGRRSAPVRALDLDTVTAQAGAEVFAVFGRDRLVSTPLWLRDTLAVSGHDGARALRVVVRTDRREELLAALRADAMS